MWRTAAGIASVYLLLLPCSLLVLGGAAVSGTAGCAQEDMDAAPTSSVDVDAEQMANATRIVAAVRGFEDTRETPYAAVVALATAMQESTLRNLRYGDRDSLGLFQQRPSQGWGTPEQVLDVEHATRSFLSRLVNVPDWVTVPLTEAAAAVQRPAAEYAGLYARWEGLADRLVGRLWNGVTSAVSSEDCAADVTAPTGSTSSGAVVYPVPDGFIGSDSRNWGGHGGRWSSWHTGTDFSVPCGTPVRASTDGHVEIENGPSWFGDELVKVSKGANDLTTWYAHMQAVEVGAGDQVAAGKRLGEVGALGNASGCHLHFEVHLRNGSIYGSDNVNPSTWLASNTRRTS